MSTKISLESLKTRRDAVTQDVVTDPRDIPARGAYVCYILQHDAETGALDAVFGPMDYADATVLCETLMQHRATISAETYERMDVDRYMVWNDATDTVRYTRYRYALGKRRATRARPNNAASRDAATAC